MFSWSCVADEAPFTIGGIYSLEEIDALCLEIGVEQAEIG